MSISSKTRKQLWALSGNRCAICKKLLFQKNEKGESCNVGEECHIISEKPNGPRHYSNYGDYDSYENLILLCNEHHKTIDDFSNISTYPPHKLYRIKSEHENWVERTLGKRRPTKEETDDILRKLDLTR